LQPLSKGLVTAALRAANSPAFPIKKPPGSLSVILMSLHEEQRKSLGAVCKTSATAMTAYQLVQTFMSMARKRTGEQLDAWLEAVAQSQLEELQSFAAGVERDKTAVVAGLTWPYSQGQVEGQVTKLKLIKRSMYGRAGLDLLRQRVLHAA
jgi:transposase